MAQWRTCLSLCLHVLTPKLLEEFRAQFVLEYSHWTLSSELDIGSCSLMGLYSGVGGTRYGLDGPGIESFWGRDFPHPYRPVLGYAWSPI